MSILGVWNIGEIHSKRDYLVEALRALGYEENAIHTSFRPRDSEGYIAMAMVEDVDDAKWAGLSSLLIKPSDTIDAKLHFGCGKDHARDIAKYLEREGMPFVYEHLNGKGELLVPVNYSKAELMREAA